MSHPGHERNVSRDSLSPLVATPLSTGIVVSILHAAARRVVREKPVDLAWERRQSGWGWSCARWSRENTRDPVESRELVYDASCSVDSHKIEAVLAGGRIRDVLSRDTGAIRIESSTRKGVGECGRDGQRPIRQSRSEKFRIIGTWRRGVEVCHDEIGRGSCGRHVKLEKRIVRIRTCKGKRVRS